MSIMADAYKIVYEAEQKYNTEEEYDNLLNRLYYDGFIICNADDIPNIINDIKKGD